MLFTDLGPLAVGGPLVFLIVTMIPVDQVLELSYLVLEMDGLDFGIVQLGICKVSFPGHRHGLM